MANASSYYEALRQLRTLQLKTDKEMQAFAQKAAADIDGAGSMTALLAAAAAHDGPDGTRTGLFPRPGKMTRDISSSASAALISGQNPWQERMAEIAEGAARFLAQATQAPWPAPTVTLKPPRSRPGGGDHQQQPGNHLDRVAAR